MLEMDAIGRTCLGALAHAMRLPHNAFLNLLDDVPLVQPAYSVLDTVLYKAKSPVGCESHTDQGLLTVIYSPHSSALQVTQHTHKIPMRTTLQLKSCGHNICAAVCAKQATLI
jgi:isopenicillin N synthase-like dioxygenase